MKSGDVIDLVFDILTVLLFLAFGFVAAFPWILFFLGLIAAIIAMKKGRSFFTWWLYGMWLFLIALVHSLGMKANKQSLEQA